MTAPIDVTFSQGTTITSDWLNGVNDSINNATSNITGSIPRKLTNKLSDVVSVKDFGAVGNGVTDDYPKLQAALNAAIGKTLDISDGIFLCLTGSPQVFSNTRIVGNGVIVQPNYYSYNRPTVPYDKAAVVDWNGLWMDVGTNNVSISGIEIRGPFYRADGDYTTHPVENWPANNGIHVRGRDYQYRKSLSPVGESSFIDIRDVTIIGFAEDAIQLDNVTTAHVRECDLSRCGRGGVRVYGGLRNWINENNISYLSPGDYLNNGNRMYGVTFTRVYGGDIADYRPSTFCSANGNKIRSTPYWKALDTHGGQYIQFHNNQVYGAHIAIGVDKGGFTAEDGYAPPRNISIIGNQLLRAFPDNPLEGDKGECGAAIFVVANDATDVNIGKSIVVTGNTIDGWGPDYGLGAVTYSNWIGVKHYGNIIKNSRRSAVCIREEFEGSVCDDTIDNVVASTALVQDGIAVESATCVGRIGATTFVNREVGTLRAITLATPNTGYGFTIEAGQIYRQLGAGGFTKVNNAINEQLGPITMRCRAVGRINADGTIHGARGIASCTKTGTGTYDVVISEDALASTSLWPVVSPIAGSVPNVSAIATATNTIAVNTRNAAGTATDSGFIINVFGY